jgi:tetratricopeptide (TPR) repeat protein
LYKKGEYARALTLLQESAGKIPDNPELQFHLGMALYMLADEPAARDALQRALANGSAFPGDGEARDALAILLLSLDSAAAPVLEKRLAARPDDPVAGLRVTQLHEQKKDAAGARDIYQSLIAKYPQNTAALLGLARLLQNQGSDQAKALDLAKTAYRLAPEDPEVAHTLGQLLYSTGEYKWAVSLLQSAAAKQPNDASVLFDLANAGYSIGEIDDAAMTMRKVLQTADPAFDRADEARLFVELLAIEANPIQSANTQARINDALKTDHDFLPALAARAALAEQTGDVKTAMNTCEEILKRYPVFIPALRRLALLLAASGSDDKRATTLLYKAREAYPSDPRIARGLGLAVYRNNDFPRALTYLTESSTRFPNDPEVFYCLGLTQASLKDRSAAKQSLLHALALDPQSAHAKEAQQFLDQAK